MIDIKAILEKTKELFSENGLQIANLFIKLDSPTDINISVSKNSVKLSFTKNKANVKIKKLISFSVGVSAINFTEDGGVLEIDHFPDIPFKFDWITNE